MGGTSHTASQFLGYCQLDIRFIVGMTLKHWLKNTGCLLSYTEVVYPFSTNLKEI